MHQLLWKPPVLCTSGLHCISSMKTYEVQAVFLFTRRSILRRHYVQIIGRSSVVLYYWNVVQPPRAQTHFFFPGQEMKIAWTNSPVCLISWRKRKKKAEYTQFTQGGHHITLFCTVFFVTFDELLTPLWYSYSCSRQLLLSLKLMMRHLTRVRATMR